MGNVGSRFFEVWLILSTKSQRTYIEFDHILSPYSLQSYDVITFWNLITILCLFIDVSHIMSKGMIGLKDVMNCYSVNYQTMYMYKVCKDPSTEILYCVSDMVFAETKYNYHIAVFQMASTPSPSLNWPEYMNMQILFIS